MPLALAMALFMSAMPVPEPTEPAPAELTVTEIVAGAAVIGGVVYTLLPEGSNSPRVQPVPEPTTLFAVATALVALGRRRKRA